MPTEHSYTFQQTLALKTRFDLASWQLGEYPDLTRYAYTHPTEFFSHAAIARNGDVAPLELEPDTNIGAIKAKTHVGEKSFDQWTQDHLDAVIVIRRGKIVYEQYPRMRPTDKHIWWSVSKSVAGTLVGLLEAEGKVDSRQAIETYIPELAQSEWRGIAVIDILDMASGMTGLEADDPEAYTNPESPYGLFESSLGIMANTSKTMASTYDYIATLRRQKNPGEVHEYTSVNTFVLSWLVEKVTDKPYAEVVSDVFWKNMGADADAQLQVSGTGAPGSHGMISSTLRDLGRYGMLFTPSWKTVSAKKIVPDALIKKLQTSGRPEIIRAGIGYDYFKDYALGDLSFSTYQFDYTTTDGDFAKAGYHGQTLYISPGKDLVVASFATLEGYDTFKFARTLAKSLE